MFLLPFEKIHELKSRLSEIEMRMSGSLPVEEYIKLNSEYVNIKPIVEKIDSYDQKKEEEKNLLSVLSDQNIDQELKELVEIELCEIEKQKEILENEIKYLLLPKDADNEKSSILEIRSGTGGLEAALFVGDLFRMYERYSSLRKWKVELLSASEGDAGGYKEIIAAISGQGVFSRLKFESGVHRVQRVPMTEASGRVHTSAATVAVLPEAKDVDIDIAPEDIRIDTMRSSGAGGQHVNTTDSAVRITHIPSGIVVTSSEKSQHQNRLQAMKVLRARLYDIERRRLESERSAKRKAQVGSGDRSERIRTYNFSQGRVTDHRINLTLYKLDRMLEGDIDEMIDALLAEHQAEILVSLDK